MNTIEEWLALHAAVVHRPRLGHVLLARFATPARIIAAPRDLLDATDGEWNIIQQVRSVAAATDLAALLRVCARQQITIITWDDARYPEWLRQIADPPLVLFVRGCVEALAHYPKVAIVGTRKCSPAGHRMATELSEELSNAGVQIVSGLAYGIDAAAHAAAYRSRSGTIGVLASGVDSITPRGHTRLGHDLMRTGCLCSEYLPGTSAEPFYYPCRNRLISGLCSAVVIVEAEIKSGTMWTAEHAVRQGRLVLAVPGLAGSKLASAAHMLIREGAVLVENAAQVLEAIRPLHASTIGHADETLQTLSPPAMGQPLLDWLATPRSLDDIVAFAGRPTHELLGWLTTMELAGRCRVTVAGQYQIL